MPHPLAAFVLALIGGAAGAFAVTLLQPAADDALAPDRRRESLGRGDIDERLERIEASLARLGANAVTLEGRGPETTAGVSGALSAAQEERLVSLIEARVGETVTTTWETLAAKEAAAEPEEPEAEPRRRVSLAEAAREIGLSASEEAALRQVYEESEEKFLALLAGPDGTVADVRRDLETLDPDDPRSRQKLIAKYMPRVLPKIGDMMAIQMEREARVEEILGPERAERYDRYDIIEENPFGMGAEVGIEARTR